MIEPGWVVRTADGEEVAHVHDIILEKSTWYQRFAWKWLSGRKR